MSKLDIIKAHHFKMENGVLILNPKEYTWYIPKKLKAKSVEIQKVESKAEVENEAEGKIKAKKYRKYMPVVKKLDK